MFHLPKSQAVKVASCLLMIAFLTVGNICAQNYDQWDAILKEHVSENGKVDYAGIKKDQSVLNSFLQEVSKKQPNEQASKLEQIAYWSNLYNAFTVKTIIDDYPINSIMDLEGGKVWDKASINVEGKELTLNMIEHEIIRKKYFDPRIHFILNCAAKSCPKLYNRAFTKENVEGLMQQLAIEFINNSSKNQISKSKAEVSQLFNWYNDDFTKSGSLINFLNKYSKVKLAESAKITYMDYDWSLNSISK